MKTFLARYGRQSLLQWDDVPVTTLKRWYKRLCDLIEMENEMTRLNER